LHFSISAGQHFGQDTLELPADHYELGSRTSVAEYHYRDS
jgi:hypothetical protein